MKKIILIVVVALIVIVGGVAFYILSSLDSLVKTAIESVGSSIAGVKVTVADVKISLTNGTGTLTGLSVGNPPGFKSDTAFKLGAITLALDIGTVTQNPIVIKQITVASPVVTYEVGSNGGSNISAIQSNVQKASGGGSAQSSSSSTSGNSPKLVIDKLDITKGTVALATPIPGVQGSGTLGDIHLTGIGRSSGGATTTQVAEQVLDALTKSAMNAANSMGVSAALDKLKGAASGITGGITGGGSSGSTGGITDKASEGIKSLFGK